MPNDNLKSYLHLHLIVFIWGFTAILGELITLDALPLVWFRMLLAVGFIVLFMAYKKTNFVVPRKTIFGFLLLGLVIALHWLTFFKAIKVSNVSVTLACLSTGAFFTSFLEPILYRRKVIWYEVLFGLIVVVGLYIIFNVEGDYYLGIILALTSAFLSALFSVINGKYAKMYDSTVISFYELTGGVLYFSIYLLLSNSFSKDFFILQPSDWVYLLILSSICTAYAFIASVRVMKFISPYTVMLTINLEPVYGIILALLIFKDKEKMSSEFYFGAILILITVILNGVIKYKLRNRNSS
ncbi:DMT family transporter [Flavobacterium sp.]|uniref:DMT family transporter n=1 Tax=Flavobacterium sp. TaxID=239 RepID=UPI0025BB40B7|nr:DMT family transporter [Flavobacterium sp.]MBA4154025.1 EamA family transporter [Flavobacterium sp.]